MLSHQSHFGLSRAFEQHSLGPLNEMLKANEITTQCIRDGTITHANLHLVKDMMGIMMRELPESSVQTVIQGVFMYTLATNDALAITTSEYVALLASPCVSVIVTRCVCFRVGEHREYVDRLLGPRDENIFGIHPYWGHLLF